MNVRGGFECLAGPGGEERLDGEHGAAFQGSARGPDAEDFWAGTPGEVGGTLAGRNAPALAGAPGTAIGRVVRSTQCAILGSSVGPEDAALKNGECFRVEDVVGLVSD